MKRFFLIVLLLVVRTLTASCQIALDSASIVIGSQTELTIAQTDHYPTPDELSQNGIVAVRQWFDTAMGTQHSLITSFEPGEHWLHIGDDSILLTVRDVAEVDTTTDQIRDIADIEAVPLRFWDVARWVVLVLLILLVAAAVWYVVRRIRQRKPIIQLSKAPPLPDHEVALNALETLRRKQLWQQGAIKEYHTELTDIVRQYLEARCGITSTEMTSDQTLEAFVAWWQRNRGTDDRQPEQLLEDMLRTADMVKFAKSEPLPYEHDRSMTEAVELVQTLTPKPETHE